MHYHSAVFVDCITIIVFIIIMQDYHLNMKATSSWDACMHMYMYGSATRSRFGTADPNHVYVYYILFDLL